MTDPIRSLQSPTAEYPPSPDDTPGKQTSAGTTVTDSAWDRPSLEADRPRVSAPPGYVIEEELGRGGMGVVYRARHLGLGRIVALKMILAGPYATPQDRQRFVQEARAAAKLRHPGIVQVFEVGEHEGRPYFTLEYLEGGALSRLARDPLPPRDAAALVGQVARGVAHAHENGIIHRDLKPDNILLQHKEAPKSAEMDRAAGGPTLADLWHPKVADFGLAKAADGDALTATGAVVGTPNYMAPEQARGETKQIGPAADIYALGAILYRLLTGRAPFAAPTPFETMHQVMTAEPPPPSHLVPRLPRDLETICLQCLRKEPWKRYASADALADDLGHWLDGQPILARPSGVLQRSWRWTRRNRWQVATATVVIAALSAGAAVALWQKDQADSSRADAVAEALNARNAEAKERDARRDADARQAEAERQARVANAVKEYLEEVLTQGGATKQASPTRKVNRAISVVEAMNYAAAGLAGRFVSEPRIEAEIRHVIGQTYADLAEYARAEEQFRLALAILEKDPGPDSRDALSVAGSLAAVYEDQGRPADAEPLFARVLSVRERTLGPDDPSTLVSANNYGLLLKHLARLDEAENLYRRVLTARERLLGPAHPHTLASVMNLGALLEERGNFDGAEALYRQSLEGTTAVLGPDHPDTLSCLKGLAGIYEATGRSREALPLYQRALRGFEASHGPTHPETLGCLNDLAGVYETLGRYSEAEPLYRRALDGCEKTLGANHPMTLTCAHNLGYLFDSSGSPDKASPFLVQALAGRELTLGADHPETLASVGAVAGNAYRLGQLDRAADLFVRALKGREKLNGLDHPDTLGVVDNLAAVRSAQGRDEEAESLHRRALTGRETVLGPEHPSTATSASNLAFHFHKCKQYAAAEPLYLRALAVREKALGREHPYTLQTLNNLCVLYEDLNDPSKAEPRLRALLAARKHLAPDQPDTHYAGYRLGKSLLAQKKFTEAESFLLDAYHGFERRQHQINDKLRSGLFHGAAEALALTYEATGKPTQAAHWRTLAAKHTPTPKPTP